MGKPRPLVPEPRRCGSSHRSEGEYEGQQCNRRRPTLLEDLPCEELQRRTCWKSGAFWGRVTGRCPRSAPQSESGSRSWRIKTSGWGP